MGHAAARVGADPPKDVTITSCDAVACRPGRRCGMRPCSTPRRPARGGGIALQDGTKPSVAKVATDAGDAVELRWATGTLHNATRFLLIPDGYCEVTILRAPTDAGIASYFASVQVRP